MLPLLLLLLINGLADFSMKGSCETYKEFEARIYIRVTTICFKLNSNTECVLEYIYTRGGPVTRRGAHHYIYFNSFLLLVGH